MASEVPDPIARFLNVNVENVAQLELLLQVRAAPDRWWSGADVARDLATRPLVAERDLAHLHARGLVERAGETTPSFRYAPGSLAPIIDQLADIYARRRTTIVNLIFAEPREDAVSLAEAFRLRRK